MCWLRKWLWDASVGAQTINIARTDGSKSIGKSMATKKGYGNTQLVCFPRAASDVPKLKNAPGQIVSFCVSDD